MKKIDLIIIVIAIIFLLGGVTLIFFHAFSMPILEFSFENNSILLGRFGDFIGGFIGTVFSLIAIILLYKTLIAQQKSIKNQEDAFKIELFEKTFFNLLNTQQEITNNLKAYYYSLKRDFTIRTNTVLDREVFLFAKGEISYIWKSFSSQEYLGMYSDNDEHLIDTRQEVHELHNPTRGVHPYEAETEEREFRENERIRLANYRYKITRDFWESIQEMEIKQKMEETYRLYFNKYHYAIGHYFRNLYHIIKFTKESTTQFKSNIIAAKRYIAFIQAQMSSYELLLLFYNSLLFPKLLSLLNEYDFLQNLAEDDLIDVSHNCIDGLRLMSRKELIGK